MIYINFNHKNVHWFLIVINKNSEEIVFYDTERYTDLTLAKTACNNLVKFLFKKQGWKFNINRDVQQPSPKHCGVYNMLFLQRSLCNESLYIPTTETEIVKVRYEIALKMLEETFTL